MPSGLELELFRPKFDCLIVDCALTRETMRLLSFLDVVTHLNRVARELLLAVRALFDEGFENFAWEMKPGSRRKAQRVKVE